MTGFRFILAVLMVTLLGVASATAGDGPLPTIPKGMGDHCVADTQFMRRNHMEMLKHHRVETMRDGIRTRTYSLANCFTCHVVKGADGKPVTIRNPAHFCNACHEYAGVRPDCFDCHASTPNAPEQRAVP
ncbi:MAG: Hdr-like menaquinol oxidoreductase cytochrome c subunit [Alphaproteobacteria bacterium]|nr:Hdr-like menaquinol oxidoreductase cytochrome c subunit [Alphaproteobacteria bacterium]